MDESKLFTEVASLDDEAVRRPLLFRLRVWSTVAAGYFILLGIPVFAVLVGLVALPFLVFGLVAGVATTVAMYKALRATYEPPKGIVVTEANAPELFKLVESVRTELRAPRPDTILLTTAFNASMTERPRYIFGGWTSALAVGFPLLLSLTESQCRAVIGHEIAHLANRHGRSQIHIHRLRITCARLSAGFANLRGVVPWFYKFVLAQYEPQLAACDLVLDRGFETTCDTMSARCSSARDAAETLVRLNTIGALTITPYWTRFWRENIAQEIPPNPYENLFTALQTPPDHTALLTQLQIALLQKTGPTDSHPSLSQRLTALGFALPITELSKWATPAAPSAFAKLFVANRVNIFSEMNRFWIAEVGANWSAQRTKVMVLIETRRHLGDKAGREPLTAQEMMQLAEAIMVLEGVERVRPQLEILISIAPEILPPYEWLGTYLLSLGDASGLPLVDHALSKNPLFRRSAYGSLMRYHARLGNQNEAEKYRQLEGAAQSEFRRGILEGNRITVKDKFEDANLAPQYRAQLFAMCRVMPDIDRLYVFLKTVRFLPEVPCFVYVAVPKHRWDGFRSSDPRAKPRILAALAKVGHPTRANFYVMKNQRKLEKKIAQVKGALIYDSAKSGKASASTTPAVATP